MRFLPLPRLLPERAMTRSARSNGSPLNSTAFTSVKTVVLAPMHSASVMTTTAVNAGSLASIRNPKRTSCSKFILRMYTQRWRRKFGLQFENALRVSGRLRYLLPAEGLRLPDRGRHHSGGGFSGHVGGRFRAEVRI